MLKKTESAKEKDRKIFLDAQNCSDDQKREYFKQLQTEEYKARLICTFSNDEIKLEYLKVIRDEVYRTEIICSLESDQLKQEYLVDIYKTIDEEYDRLVKIPMAFDNDESLKYRLAKRSEAQIICSMKNPEIQLKLFNQHCETDYYFDGHSLSPWQVEMICNIKDTNIQLSLFREYIVGNPFGLTDTSCEIICVNASDEIKWELIKGLDDEKHIEAIVDSLSSEELKEKFAQENPWYTREQDRYADYYDPYEGEEPEDDHYEETYYEEEQSEVDLKTLSFEELSELDEKLDAQIMENAKAIEEEKKQQRRVLIERVKGKRDIIKVQEAQLQKFQQEKDSQVPKDTYQH